MKKSDPFKVRKSRGSRINPVPPVYKPVERPVRPDERKPKPKPKPPKQAALALIREAMEITARIENMKPLYGRLDDLMGILAKSDLSGTGVMVVDLFEGKTQAWKSVCFRRYEIRKAAK